jgi:tetratricopeptide (TPR) repeat protein
VARPADASDLIASRPSGPSPVESAPGRHTLDFRELTSVDVADIVWLASAIRPADPEQTAAPHIQHKPPIHTIKAVVEDVEFDIPAQPQQTHTARPAPALPDPPEQPQAIDGDTRGEPRLPPRNDVDVTRIGLPDSLRLFRALRPLKREIPSHRDDALVLDEETTADWAAQTGVWWPMTRARRERWLDLTLVVDTGGVPALWRSRVNAFVTLLERLGAFRSIQVRQLDTIGTGNGPVLRGATPDAPERDPAEILDSSGRRAVLVITDGVGEAWRRNQLMPMLAGWGRRMPVTVLHLLPQHLWSRCGMVLHRARLGVPTALMPNNRWTLELPDAWLEPDSPTPKAPGPVPIPVVALQPRWLSWWARLITGGHRGQTNGRVLLADDESSMASMAPQAELSATELVHRFRSLASPPALRLATLLAALPVHLDVVHLVQRRFITESRPEDLSELLLNGLLYSTAQQDGEGDTTAFAFPEAVRGLLLNGARRSETAGVVRAAAAYFGERLPVLGHIRDAIADPHNTPDPVVNQDNVANIELESAIMRALSGPYLSRADRLNDAVRQEAVAVLPTSESVKRPVQPILTSPPIDKSTNDSLASDDMRDTAERADRPNEPVTPAGSPNRYPGNTLEVADPVTMQFVSSGETRPFQSRRPDDPPPIWGNVPPKNPNFTGREELLEQLGKRLTAGGTTAVLPSALHGMGGIGKTQIATEYIYRHLRDYDLIWWIEAARTTQIRASLTDLARELGLPGAGDANTAVRAVREALRTGKPYGRWLLVFDAADSPEEVRSFFPTNGPGEVLITSRNPDWAGVARPLELSVFKRDESIELLRKRGPVIDATEADELADKLGDLPLAVEQAAAWRAVTGMPVREYLRLFDESLAEILDMSTPPDYDASVAAAWNVSFDELKNRNPAAHQILHICAFFSPEPISRDLFTGVNRIAISPELDAALRDPIKLARAIRDINRYSLAKIDHGNNTIQLHRLVQLVLRSRVIAPQILAQMKHGAHQLLASLDPNDPESSRHWPRYRELLPHAYAADIIACDESWARQLVINLMRYLFQWGDHEEAAALASRARAAFEERLGPTHPQTLDVSQRLGLYLWGLGRYQESAHLNQLTLKRRLEVSGEEGEETFAVQTNIVADLRAKGEFTAATELSDEIYHKTTRLFGEDDPETLNAAFQHALNLRLSGKYREASELDADTLRRRIEVLGPDHPRTLSTNVGLIVDLREAGEYMRARIDQEKLTEIARSRIGEDNPDYITYFFVLSVARRKDGDHAGALSLSTKAFERFKIVYGVNHPTTIACTLAHSIDLRHSGDLNKAKALGEETFERYRGILGEDHPHTLAATVDLAVTLRLRSEVANARELNERALEQLRTSSGPDHPYVIITTINLASDLAALGEIDAAVELDREALDRCVQVLGPDHPTALAAAFNLSLDLRAAGRYDEAEPYHGPTLDRYRRVLGEAHPGTIAAVKGARADCDIDPMLM